jgi:hypothetical protein
MPPFCFEDAKTLACKRQPNTVICGREVRVVLLVMLSGENFDVLLYKDDVFFFLCSVFFCLLSNC